MTITDAGEETASTIVRTKRENLPGTSERKSAAVIPSGIVMASATEISIKVPTIACAAPPLVSGSSGPVTDMSCVNRFQCQKPPQPR